MTKQDAITKAQIIANRRGITLAVLTLNPFQPNQCVMREWDQRYEGSKDLVAKITPEQSGPVTVLSDKAHW